MKWFKIYMTEKYKYKAINWKCIFQSSRQSSLQIFISSGSSVPVLGPLISFQFILFPFGNL